ncbi:MAG: nitrogenase component 1 [Selenomonadaceae bacterium]|nr:nitrogenase component 1 [Selenomonadaceae bacterium]
MPISYPVSTLDPHALPSALTTRGHLILSSPATIDFNSPGAQGFGVKRAGLTVPGSLMLLISPTCCGRNTRALSGPGHYGERFAYLELTSTDIITGAHLSKIPEAARLFLESRTDPPSCLLLCTTCVDALLGTDMDRIAKKTEALIHLPTRPCYMYALTRESLHPPMVQVRETIASLLEKESASSRPQTTSVNLLGFFSPIAPSSELFPLLRSLGIQTIRQIATCSDYDDFQRMAEAHFNLVLHPESLPAAEQMAERLHIPYITLRRFYTPGRIHKQYQALARALGKEIDDTPYYQAAKTAIHHLKEPPLPPPCTKPDSATAPTIALGSRMSADPLDLALLLTSCGFRVTDIFTTLDETDAYFLNLLRQVSPHTRLHGSLDPTMALFESEHRPDLTIGADAATYYPTTPNIPWNEEIQPFGYQAPLSLLEKIRSFMERNDPK